jgi:hypothetical protein
MVTVAIRAPKLEYLVRSESGSVHFTDSDPDPDSDSTALHADDVKVFGKVLLLLQCIREYYY